MLAQAPVPFISANPDWRHKVHDYRSFRVPMSQQALLHDDMAFELFRVSIERRISAQAQVHKSDWRHHACVRLLFSDDG